MFNKKNSNMNKIEIQNKEYITASNIKKMVDALGQEQYANNQLHIINKKYTKAGFSYGFMDYCRLEKETDRKLFPILVCVNKNVVKYKKLDYDNNNFKCEIAFKNKDIQTDSIHHSHSPDGLIAVADSIIEGNSIYLKNILPEGYTPIFMIDEYDHFISESKFRRRLATFIPTMKKMYKDSLILGISATPPRANKEHIINLEYLNKNILDCLKNKPNINLDFYIDTKNMAFDKLIKDIKAKKDNIYVFTNKPTDYKNIVHHCYRYGINWEIVAGQGLNTKLYPEVHKEYDNNSNTKVTIISSAGINGMDINDELERASIYIFSDFHCGPLSYHPNQCIQGIGRLRNCKLKNVVISLNNKKIKEMPSRADLIELENNLRLKIDADKSQYITELTTARTKTRGVNWIAFEEDVWLNSITSKQYVDIIAREVKGKTNIYLLDSKEAMTQLKKVNRSVTSINKEAKKKYKDDFSMESIMDYNRDMFPENWYIKSLKRTYLVDSSLSDDGKKYVISGVIKDGEFTDAFRERIEKWLKIYNHQLLTPTIRDKDKNAFTDCASNLNLLLNNYINTEGKFDELANNIKTDCYNDTNKDEDWEKAFKGSILKGMLNICHVNNKGFRFQYSLNREYNGISQLSDDAIYSLNNAFGYKTAFFDMSNGIINWLYSYTNNVDKIEINPYETAMRQVGMTRDEVKNKASILLNKEYVPMDNGMYEIGGINKHQLSKEEAIQDTLTDAEWFKTAFPKCKDFIDDVFKGKIDGKFAYQSPICHRYFYYEEAIMKWVKSKLYEICGDKAIKLTRKHDAMIISGKDLDKNNLISELRESIELFDKHSWEVNEENRNKAVDTFDNPYDQDYAYYKEDNIKIPYKIIMSKIFKILKISDYNRKFS